MHRLLADVADLADEQLHACQLSDAYREDPNIEEKRCSPKGSRGRRLR